MTDLVNDTPDSIPQVTPKDHPHLKWIQETVAGEFKRQSNNGEGINMSDNISKDWIERKLDSIDNKIEIEKVKSDAKFDKLITESNIKFERLIGEMNTKFAMSEAKIAQSESSHTKWMIGIAFTLIALTLTAITFSTNLILRAIPSISSQVGQQTSIKAIENKPVPPETPK